MPRGGSQEPGRDGATQSQTLCVTLYQPLSFLKPRFPLCKMWRVWSSCPETLEPSEPSEAKSGIGPDVESEGKPWVRQACGNGMVLGRLTASQTGRGTEVMSQVRDPPHPIHPPTWQPKHHPAQGWTHEQQQYPRTNTLVKMKELTRAGLCLGHWTESEGSPSLLCF